MSLLTRRSSNVNYTDDGVAPLQREMNRLFSNFFGDFGLPSIESERFSATPAIDIVENDKAYRVNVELPAINSEDVDISINENYLTIKGEKKEEKEEHNGNTVVRSERYYGSYQRTISLPQNVDTDKAKASFEKGVLTIEIPKKIEAQSKSRKLKISRIAD